MTEVESPCFLDTQNNYPTEELGKFMETLKGNSPVYQAYQRFFDTYKVNGVERTEQNYTNELSKLQKELTDIAQKHPKNPRLEVCGPVASGKTFWAEKIMHIIRKLGGNVHDETVENDISDKFDTYILGQLHQNRDSDFFKKNLRNIGYTTMRCFGQNGCHAAPFSNGTQLRAYTMDSSKPQRCPGIVIETSGEQRMQNFVGRGAARDEGRVPYTAEISTEVKNYAGVSVIHNNGDLDETSDDIFQFILKNKEYYHIQEDEKTIRKTINTVLSPVVALNKMKETQNDLIETFIKQQSDYDRELSLQEKQGLKKQLFLTRNQNAWGFIEKILSESGASSDTLKQIQQAYNSAFNLEELIIWNDVSFSTLQKKVLSPYQINDEVCTKIKTTLSSKNITEAEHNAYANAVYQQNFVECHKDNPRLRYRNSRKPYFQRLITGIYTNNNPSDKSDQVNHQLAKISKKLKLEPL